MNKYIFLLLILIFNRQSYCQLENINYNNTIFDYLFNKGYEFIDVKQEFKASVNLKEIITYSISNKKLLAYKNGPVIYSNILVFKIKNGKTCDFNNESSYSNKELDKCSTITTKDIPILYAKFEKLTFDNLTDTENKERLMKTCFIYIYNENSKLWERLMKDSGHIVNFSNDMKTVFFQTKKYGIFGIGCRQSYIHKYHVYVLIILLSIIYI